MIPYGHQSIDEDDVAAVVEALHGDWLTQGPGIAAFEGDLAAICEVRHAVAFSSGTAALHAAAAAAGLRAGDRVATSALSFAASANCALYVGATPVLVDIDPATLNLDPVAIPADVDAVVAVHYAGLPVDLERLAPRPRIIIEDAAHALGACTPDGPVGNCTRSDLCMFSFHPVKAITTGEGGAVTTNSDELASSLRRFRHHGIVGKPEVAGWYYEIEELGYNYRLTDIQAALGRSQLRKLGPFVARRNDLARRYDLLLADLPVLRPPTAPEGWRHGYHLYPVRVPDRTRVYEGMQAAGVGVQVHYVPIYRHPVYAALGLEASDFPATEEAYGSLLSLPLYPGLSEVEQDRVVALLADLLP